VGTDGTLIRVKDVGRAEVGARLQRHFYL